MKQLRRLIEEDLALPPKTLDAEPHKSSIRDQVDEARGSCWCSFVFTPHALANR